MNKVRNVQDSGSGSRQWSSGSYRVVLSSQLIMLWLTVHLQSHCNSLYFNTKFQYSDSLSLHEILLMELCFISSYSGGFDVRSWFKYKFILCFYSPVGVYFQREAWCYWCLLFTTLYASRRRGNLIYFSTNRISLSLDLFRFDLEKLCL